MKKLISVVLAFISAFAFSLVSFAETVNLEEFGLTLETPENLITVTWDTPKDHIAFSEHFQHDSLMEFLREENLYVFSFSEDAATNLTVYVDNEAAGVTFMEGYSYDADIEKVSDYLVEDYEKAGYKNIVAGTYENDYLTFVTLGYEFSAEDVPGYSLDYFTFVGGNYIILSYFSYYDEITEEEIADLNAVANSLYCSNVIPEEEAAPLSSSAKLIIIILVCLLAVAAAFILPKKIIRKK